MLAVQAVTLDVEDLEADATPEDLMLSYVSGEKGKVLLLSLLDSRWTCAFSTEVAVHKQFLRNLWHFVFRSCSPQTVLA